MVPIAVESSQHHVGGVQRVDKVRWESIFLFNCVWPPEKGENNLKCCGYLHFHVLKYETGIFVSLLKWPHYEPCRSLPVRQLAKQDCVCACYVLHKRAVPPEDVPIKMQSRLQSFLTNFCRNGLSMWREPCRNCCYAFTALKEEDLTCDIKLT